MSKRDRLDRQKSAQDKLKKSEELKERQAASNAKTTSSRPAQKMMKKAKKEKATHENGLFLFAKILMLIPFAYSGLYYGGLTVLGISKGYMENTPTWIAYAVGIGSVAILIGIILSFAKKYFSSFAFVLAGTISYMKGAMFVVNIISTKLEKLNGAVPDLEGMDKNYRYGYYPIIGVLIISFILALTVLIRFINKRKALKEKQANAPIKSIIGD